jgi:hypothetical protein
MIVRLVKIQLAAEFILDEDGEELEPGTFGPVALTAREWASFDLQAEVEKGVTELAGSTSVQPAPDPS